MADEHDRTAVVSELVDLAVALDREVEIADGEHLVDEHHVGLRVDGDGEPQPREHAAAVRANRRVDEVSDLAELDDLLEPPCDLALPQPENRARHLDVLAAGQDRVETGIERDQRAD